MPFQELLWSLFVTVAFVLVVWGSFRVRTWLFDYQFDARGIRFSLFGGSLPIGFMPRSKIQAIAIVPFADVSCRERFLAVGLANRFMTKFLLLRTSLPVRFWILTPAHPERALEALEWNR